MPKPPPSIPQPEELKGKRGGALSRQDAASYLSISTRLLDDLLSAGEITRIKIGRKTLVRVCDLDDYLARLAEEAVS
jgi:excisionase family DNA binding protein